MILIKPEQLLIYIGKFNIHKIKCSDSKPFFLTLKVISSFTVMLYKTAPVKTQLRAYKIVYKYECRSKMLFFLWVLFTYICVIIVYSGTVS